MKCTTALKIHKFNEINRIIIEKNINKLFYYNSNIEI